MKIKHFYKSLSSTLLILLAAGNLAASSPTPPISSNKEMSLERIVYGSKSSPFVFKVLVAMAEKGLDFKHIETLPISAMKAKGLEPSPEFQSASPLGKIPAYREGVWTIADSSVIIAYLDRQNPDNPLYPTDPKKYAEARWYEKYGDEVVTEVVHHKILFEKIVKPKLFGKPTNQVILTKAINEELPKVLTYLEHALEGKQWITGDNFTAADIAIGNHLMVLKTCGIHLSKNKWPNLSGYAQRLFARESFQKYMS